VLEPVNFAARRAQRHALPLAVTLTLFLPLIVATIALRSEPWAPIFDMALIEQSVRDVGTTHTPLIGLPGRLGPAGHPASHPGPLGFFLLVPVYRLLGSSAWALQASAAFLNAIAIALAVFVAWRRRSSAVVGMAGVGIALLMQGFGLALLTEPWNPNMPVLWFAAFLVAVWSVICRDVVMMPVVVTTASICAQTHIPYVPVCGALGALAALATALLIVRATKGSDERKRGVRSFALAFALLFVLWLPPVIEELRAGPGNISRLIQYFGDPELKPFGMHGAVVQLFYRYNAKFLVIDQWIAPGGFDKPIPLAASALASGITLSFWVLCALGAVALRNRSLLALHGLVLAGIGVAILAVSRILGFPASHVMFWSFGLGVLLVVACLATIACAAEHICPASVRLRLASLGPVFAAGAVLCCTLRLAWAAPKVLPNTYRQTRQTQALARDTITAIHQGAGVARGSSGRYLVSWSDCLHGGALGIGLGNELERAGFDAAYDLSVAALVGARRTRDPSWATARVHFANGAWIAETRRVLGGLEVSWVDLRTAEEREETEILRAAIVKALHASGSLEALDYDVHGTIAAHPGLHPYIILAQGRLTDLGMPAAVFILPPWAMPMRTVY
jgi:hypothetical protein